MTGSTHRKRIGRVVTGVAAALLALAGCGGEERSTTSASAVTEIPDMEKGQRDVPLPREGGVVARVASGDLPEGFPADLPAPPDSEAKNALFIPGQGGLATFISKSPRENLGSYFEQELPENGWNVDETTAGDDRITIMASKGERKAKVLIVTRAQGTEIAITLQGG